MGSHDPFGHLKHKLWPKEGSRVKLAIWLPTTKSLESPRFPYMQVTWNIPLESSWQGLKLCFRPDLNRRSKVAPQSCKNPNSRYFEPPFGSFETKYHSDASPVGRHKVYYKREGGGFPQVQAVVSLVNWNCMWLILAPKVFQLCTNQLVFGFVQVCVSN
jgi:hypothetical protein